MKNVDQDEEQRAQREQVKDTGNAAFSRVQAVVDEASIRGLHRGLHRPSPSARSMYPPLLQSSNNRSASSAAPKPVITANEEDHAVEVSG